MMVAKSTVHRGLLFALLVSSAIAAEAVQIPPVTGDRILQPLTNVTADATRGASIFIDRQLGHCVLCHNITTLTTSSQGNIGPDLSGVGNRLDAAQLRLRLVDSTLLNADTAMPAYHKIEGLHQVDPSYSGKPVLDAQQIEDVIAYLATLVLKGGQAQQ
jgi:sulfur-oxidizing protein SoxX